MERSSEVTSLLEAWSGGDSSALERLMPIVIDDLRGMARARIARENPGHTLQATALVNEVYLKLIGQHSMRWEDRAHFFAVMAQFMRRLLVDHSRKRRALKKGGDAPHKNLDDTPTIAGPGGDLDPIDILALDNALKRLAQLDPRQARIVELRYFGGLTLQETAESLKVSTMTIKREWRSARLWLLRELKGTDA